MHENSDKMTGKNKSMIIESCENSYPFTTNSHNTNSFFLSENSHNTNSFFLSGNSYMRGAIEALGMTMIFVL